MKKELGPIKHEAKYERRRAGAGFLLALALAGGANHKDVTNAATAIVRHVAGSPNPNIPDLPNADDPNHKEKIKEGIEQGTLIELVTDRDHPTLTNLAEAIYPDDIPSRLTLGDELVEETGTYKLPLGTLVVVPNSPKAQMLHDAQFPSDG